MPFTRHAVDTFISNKIAKVTECNIGDLYSEFPAARDWVSAFGLMVIFVNQPREEIRPFALQFVRRLEMAFAEYARAREVLQSFVSANEGQWSPYFRALYHVEAAISQLYQAFDLSRKKLDTKLFDTNDGSPLSRLNEIYNTSRHQLATEDQPIWITNQGVETETHGISFPELEELLRSCARIATKLTSTTSPDGPS